MMGKIRVNIVHTLHLYVSQNHVYKFPISTVSRLKRGETCLLTNLSFQNEYRILHLWSSHNIQFSLTNENVVVHQILSNFTEGK